ncbi:MAG: hypothetical protein LEGION0403_FIIPPAGN_02691 [Legionella sp.]|uniref:hypothetical protein n=1 Tax=Legionella sp. TaxID=459 RepID=UPI003D12FF99
MEFKSKTEAYSYAILMVNRIKSKHATDDMAFVAPIDKCINKLKISFENHEQNPGVVAGYLKELKNSTELSLEELAQIEQLQKDLVGNDYRQTPEEKYQNPLARRAESELPITLLQNPTSAMMTSVKRVSDELLKIIDDQRSNFDYYLHSFSENAHVIALGSLKSPITREAIKKILQNNNPAQLAEIMHIHFKFAQNITREISIKHAPHREPVGKLAEIVKSLWKATADLKDFFSQGLAEDWTGRRYRAYISDELMYRSELYTAPGNRGRGLSFDTSRTQQLGLMLNGQEEHETGFPKHNSSWCADCKSQSANYSSPYVLDAVENDAVYVAGPSGMTSMFLSQMETLANFENEDLKKNYLSAVVAYIVGGGFHSLHEVIGPAQNALNLVPGYQIQVPSYDHRAPAPNYNTFFAQQEAIDPEFASRHEIAWQNYLNYVNNSYALKYIEGFQHEPNHFSPVDPQAPRVFTQIPPELRQSILSEVSGYINDGVLSRGNKDNELSFISRIFRNSELTRKKLTLAIEFQKDFKSITDLDALKELVKSVKDSNKELEKKYEKTYGFFTKSGLNRAMESIEASIAAVEQGHQKQPANS